MVKRFEPPKARFEFVTKRGDLNREWMVVVQSRFESIDVVGEFCQLLAEPDEFDLVVGRVRGDCHGGDSFKSVRSVHKKYTQRVETV